MEHKTSEAKFRELSIDEEDKFLYSSNIEENPPDGEKLPGDISFEENASNAKTQKKAFEMKINKIDLINSIIRCCDRQGANIGDLVFNINIGSNKKAGEVKNGLKTKSSSISHSHTKVEDSVVPSEYISRFEKPQKFAKKIYSSFSRSNYSRGSIRNKRSFRNSYTSSYVNRCWKRQVYHHHNQFQSELINPLDDYPQRYSSNPRDYYYHDSRGNFRNAGPRRESEYLDIFNSIRSPPNIINPKRAVSPYRIHTEKPELPYPCASAMDFRSRRSRSDSFSSHSNSSRCRVKSSKERSVSCRRRRSMNYSRLCSPLRATSIKRPAPVRIFSKSPIGHSPRRGRSPQRRTLIKRPLVVRTLSRSPILCSPIRGLSPLRLPSIKLPSLVRKLSRSPIFLSPGRGEILTPRKRQILSPRKKQMLSPRRRKRSTTIERRIPSSRRRKGSPSSRSQIPTRKIRSECKISPRRKTSRSLSPRRKTSRSPSSRRKPSRSPSQRRKTHRSPSRRSKTHRSRSPRRSLNISPSHRRNINISPSHRRIRSRSSSPKRNINISPSHRRNRSRSSAPRRNHYRRDSRRSRSPSWISSSKSYSRSPRRFRRKRRFIRTSCTQRSTSSSSS